MKISFPALFAALAISAQAALAAARFEPPPFSDSQVQLQIFLDQKLFGPGKIDGRPGEFTTKALKRYQRANGLPETGLPEGLPLDTINPVYTTYEIKQGDLKFIGNCPTTPQEQVKVKYLPYESLLEFLTERFHCAPEFLQHINPGVKLGSLKVGSVAKVPNVEPFKIEDLGESGNIPEVPEFVNRVITVDTREKMLELRDGEKLLASLPITPGSSELPTPPGTWKIVGVAQLPTFRWDKSVLMTGVRSGTFFMLPIGPNNPVGVMWIGLNKPGIGIHGTNNPQTIGRAASHGCMRTANWDTVRLSKLVTAGMTVIIEGPPVPPHRATIAREKPAPEKPVLKAIPVVQKPTPPTPAPKKRFLFF